MVMHEAVARNCRGQSIGGDAARALKTRALVYMQEEGIRCPERMLDMLSSALEHG